MNEVLEELIYMVPSTSKTMRQQTTSLFQTLLLGQKLASSERSEDTEVRRPTVIPFDLDHDIDFGQGNNEEERTDWGMNTSGGQQDQTRASSYDAENLKLQIKFHSDDPYV